MSIAVVVATVDRPTLQLTLASLDAQTVKADQTIVIHDTLRFGAPWARNYGAAQCVTDWIVFSDDDVVWEPHAFEDLQSVLKDEDFAYGSYAKGDKMYCVHDFDAVHLRKRNYISTMSMVRRSAFPGFDQNVSRLQDWDLWLTMVEQGSIGVFCHSLIFRTAENDGISSGDDDDWRRAEHRIKAKHGLL